MVHYVRHNCALRCRGEWDLVKSYKTMRKRKINVLHTYLERKMFSRKHTLIAYREPGDFLSVANLIDMGQVTPAHPFFPVKLLRRVNAVVNDTTGSIFGSKNITQTIVNSKESANLTFPMTRQPLVITISPAKVNKNQSPRKKKSRKKKIKDFTSKNQVSKNSLITTRKRKVFLHKNITIFLSVKRSSPFFVLNYSNLISKW